MDFSIKKSNHFINKSLLKGLIVLLLSIVSSDLHGITGLFKEKGFIKGRIIQSSSKASVCFADIFNSNKTSFTKSNSKGEFILGPLEFPSVLSIRKFGFKEETVTINNPIDSALISLTPNEIHNSYSGNKKVLQYDIIFKKALEKLRAAYNIKLQDHSQRKLVYCRIRSSVDSTINSLFEGYAQMNVCNNGFQDYLPYVSRYASSDDNIPGLTGNILEFKIDPYVNLPLMAEQFITRKGYILQDGKQVAMVRVDLNETINTYYINVADTSVLYITCKFKSGKKERIPGSQPAWQRDKVLSAEISFSQTTGNTDDYFIDWVRVGEDYSLIMKDKPSQAISKSTFLSLSPILL
jgi:hypothetical protein